MSEAGSISTVSASDARSASTRQEPSLKTPEPRYTLDEAILEVDQIQGIGRYLCQLSGTRSLAITDLITRRSTDYLYSHFNRNLDWYEATLEYLLEIGDIDTIRRFMTDGWLLGQAEESVTFCMELDEELRQIENQDDPHLTAVLDCLDTYPTIFHHMLYKHASELVADNQHARQLIDNFGRGGEEDTFEYFHRYHRYPSELLEELERHGESEAADQLRNDPLLQAMGNHEF